MAYRLDVSTDCTDCEARIRAEVIEEVNIILKNMYLEISNTISGDYCDSKSDLVTVVASKCRQYASEKLEQLKEKNNDR